MDQEALTYQHGRREHIRISGLALPFISRIRKLRRKTVITERKLRLTCNCLPRADAVQRDARAYESQVIWPPRAQTKRKVSIPGRGWNRDIVGRHQCVYRDMRPSRAAVGNGTQGP
jgi:hypothetical protein